MPVPLRALLYAVAPWHFLNFLPLPQGHGSLRPMPAYGLRATPAPTGDGWEATAGSPLTRPSNAGLLATMGVGRRGEGPLTSPAPGPDAGLAGGRPPGPEGAPRWGGGPISIWSLRSEEHTSELQSRLHLVCRLLLEKKK